MRENVFGIIEQDGMYVYDECHYEDLAGVLQCGVLGHCGCGNPEINIKFVAEGLKIIALPYDDRKTKEIDYFGNEAMADFFYYSVCEMGLTEHGGAIPGWLTDKGKEFIKLAESVQIDED